jgi:hypothetical protein
MNFKTHTRPPVKPRCSGSLSRCRIAAAVAPRCRPRLPSLVQAATRAACRRPEESTKKRGWCVENFWQPREARIFFFLPSLFPNGRRPHGEHGCQGLERAREKEKSCIISVPAENKVIIFLFFLLPSPKISLSHGHEP